MGPRSASQLLSTGDPPSPIPFSPIASLFLSLSLLLLSIAFVPRPSAFGQVGRRSSPTELEPPWGSGCFVQRAHGRPSPLSPRNPPAGTKGAVFSISNPC